MVLVPNTCSASDVEGLIETPGGVEALDSGLTPPTNKIVQRRFIPAARSIVQSRGSTDLKTDESFAPQTLANLERMLLQMKENKETNVDKLTFEGVVPAADYMRDWPEDVTIEYHDGRPVLVTDLGNGQGLIDMRQEASAAAASASTSAEQAPVQTFEPLAMFSG